MSRISRDKLILALSIFFVIVLTIKRGKQEHTYEVFIPGQQPKEVWDLLADFRNIANLNQRILHWDLGKETTHKDGHWEYQVTSYETMAGGWLFGANVNHGNIVVKAVKAPKLYTIYSTFVTESFRGMFIIHNSSAVSLKKATREGEKGTLYKETVTMDCPVLFGRFCSFETGANRADFMEHLTKYYETVD